MKFNEYPTISAIDGADTLLVNQNSTDSVKQISASSFADIIQKRQYQFNVKDYGAIGDGVTDDIVAIQAAVDDAAAAGTGTVFFPDGKYRVSSPIVITSAVALVGTNQAGFKDGCVITTASSGNAILTILDCQAEIRDINFSLIAGAVYPGTSTRQPNTPLIVIDSTGTDKRVYFENVNVFWTGDILWARVCGLYWSNSRIFSSGNTEGCAMRLIGCAVTMNDFEVHSSGGKPCLWMTGNDTTSNRITSGSFNNGGSAHKFTPSLYTSTGLVITVEGISGHNFAIGDYAVIVGATNAAYDGFYRVGGFTADTVTLGTAGTGGTSIPGAGTTTGGQIRSVPCCVLIDNALGAYNEGMFTDVLLASTGGPYTDGLSAALYIDGNKSTSTISGWNFNNLYFDYSRSPKAIGALITGASSGGTGTASHRLTFTGTIGVPSFRFFSLESTGRNVICGLNSMDGLTAGNTSAVYIYGTASAPANANVISGSVLTGTVAVDLVGTCVGNIISGSTFYNASPAPAQTYGVRMGANTSYCRCSNNTTIDGSFLSANTGTGNTIANN